MKSNPEKGKYYPARRWGRFDDDADVLHKTREKFERVVLAEDLKMLGTDTPQWVSVDESRALIFQRSQDQTQVTGWVVNVGVAIATEHDATNECQRLTLLEKGIHAPFQFHGDIAPSSRVKA